MQARAPKRGFSAASSDEGPHMSAASPPSLPCPACGFLVFCRLYGSSDTCPVCHWVHDLSQLAQPDFVIGRNSGTSLRQAQRAALATYPIDVVEIRGLTRAPAWRPLGPSEHPKTRGIVMTSPVCYLLEPDPAVFEPYWLFPADPDPSDG